MSATSFQYRYPLSTNPSVADQRNTLLYPYPSWASNYASGAWFLGGREIPERSFFGEDFNLSARPITRVVEPTVLAYTPVSNLLPTNEVPVVVSPNNYPLVLNDRFAAIGAQASAAQTQSILILVLLVIAGFAVYWCALRRP